MEMMEYIAGLKNDRSAFSAEEAGKYKLKVESFTEQGTVGYKLILQEDIPDFGLSSWFEQNQGSLLIPEAFVALFQTDGLRKEHYYFIFYPEYPHYVESFSFACNPDVEGLFQGFLKLQDMELQVMNKKFSLNTAITGGLQIGSCNLQITVGFGDSQAQCFVYARDEKYPGFSDLVGWLGGTCVSREIQERIEAAVKTFFDLSVTGLMFSINHKTGALDYARIEGNLKLGPLHFCMGVSLPGMQMWGSLDQEQPLSVKEVFSYLGIQTGELFSQLFLTKGEYQGDFADGSHRVEAEVSGSLELGPLNIEDLGIVLDWNDGFDCSVYGKLQLWEDLTILSRITSKEKGLLLDGTIRFGEKEGQTEGIWGFLEEKFGVTTLPSWLTALNIYMISLKYDIGSDAFQFDVQGGLQINDTCKLDIAAKLVIEQDKGPKIDGQIHLAGRLFKLEYNGKELNAVYEKEGGEVFSVRLLVQGISQEAAALIPDFRITCSRIELSAALEEKKHADVSILFGGFDFGQIPVVGPVLPQGSGVEQFGFYFDSDKGVMLQGTLCIGDWKKELVLSLENNEQKEEQTPRNAVYGKAEANTRFGSQNWMDIEKGIGPFYLERLGLSYVDGGFWLMLDASLQMKALVFGFQGLSVGTRLDVFSPSINLEGIEVVYDVPPILLSGGIRRVSPGEGIRLQFDGTLSLKVNDWCVSVIASYLEREDSVKSFFAFLELNKTLGGIPAFTIEGIMGGLGINYALSVPKLQEVEKFPLMKIDTSYGCGLELLEVLEGKKKAGENQKQWLFPEEGAKWAAAGIRFSSFEMIHGKMLLVADFSDSLVLSLLGYASLSLPKGESKEKAYLYAELELAATMNPKDGVFSVQAELTPASFLIDHNCHLTGGFAFFVWYGDNPHAGDFVFTAGGYHPSFPVPAHYPKVSPVGFCWKIGNDVTIDGDAYLALTPSCIMAGGKLSVVYSHGSVKAWFLASANLLIAWKPFQFLLDAAVEVGVSARLNLLFVHKTITIKIGASLNMWGPPTGGKVRVHLWFITFTVAFGSKEGSDCNNKPLGWTDFSTLLPDKNEIIKIQAVDGLARTENSGEDQECWVVSPAAFRFRVQSAVPSSTIHGKDGEWISGNPVNIRPMNLQETDSELTVQIFNENNRSLDLRKDGWDIQDTKGAFPASLWGKPLYDEKGAFQLRETKPTSELAKDLINGLTLFVPPAGMGNCCQVEDAEALFEDAAKRSWPVFKGDDTGLYELEQGEIDMLDGIASKKMIDTRNRLFLDFMDFFADAPVKLDDMSRLENRRGELFIDVPCQMKKNRQEE